MVALVLLILSSALSADAMLPEIEVTAPRFSEQPGDSIGMIPEVTIYGEKDTPHSVSQMIRTYDHYKSSYQKLCGTLWNYGLLIIAALFIITFIIIILVKETHHRHAFVPRREKESHLHRWVRKHYDMKHGNWNK